jgi:radical SAM superfamily enzyme YgiQ (UPF0313 family)
MYVSAGLKQRGFDVKVLNYNLFDYDLVEEVKDQDYVLFTGFEEFAKDIVRDAKVCKELGVKTVLGGALATFIPDTIGKYVDKLFHWEVEDVTNLDDIPWPDYEGFGIEEYHKRHKTRYMGILTARGCPFKCTFCAQTCLYRTRHLNNVFAEIQFYKSKYGIETVVFNDNTLNVSKKRFMKICAWMKGRNLSWSASIRCDKFDEEMCKAAKESGCIYFVVGIESFTQSRLDYMNKQVTVGQIKKTLKLLEKYGINYHGNVLVGFENDSYEDIVKEVSRIPKGTNVFPVMVQPFVGTQNGKTRLISESEYNFLTDQFANYVSDRGMYLYPELKAS